ncbi:hypothetical protein NC652_028763 [Populus alba x Populus x berolinensis]|nr:hypothetical protein NC652_028763 [Populus alba x Populus x berolinensis]
MKRMHNFNSPFGSKFRSPTLFLFASKARENKVDKFVFARRFHLQAIKEAFAELAIHIPLREVQNIAAMKKNALQRNSSSSSMMKPPGSFPGKSSASTNPMKPLERRF